MMPRAQCQTLERRVHTLYQSYHAFSNSAIPESCGFQWHERLQGRRQIMPFFSPSLFATLLEGAVRATGSLSRLALSTAAFQAFS